MIRLQAGDMVGAYRILEQVGMGGMATVYKAYHAAMDRHVALKVMPFQFARNESFRQRFQQEVRTIAKLEHPHILPVYDSGEFEGMPYLVMRFLGSGTLQDRMVKRSLEIPEIDQIFTQLARALAYAHGQGVIHRDIKPANVLLNERNEIFLTDFGIAKLVESTSQITATGSITGTPSYMSPEQAQGEPLDARSDLYSLGVLLYQMVTGRVPFEAETPLAVILKHVQASLPLPSSFKPDLHPALETVILKALAKKPEDRYQNAEAFILAWQDALAQRRADPSGQHTAPPTAALLTAAAIDLGSVPNVALSTSETAIAEPDPTFVDDELAAVSVAPRGGAKERRRPTWLVASVIGLCLLAGIVAAVVVGINQFREAQNDDVLLAEGAETDSVAAAGSDTTATPIDDKLTLPAGEKVWSEWVNVSQINSIAAEGDQLLVGGQGGLLQWDLTTEQYAHIGMRDGLPSANVTVLLTDRTGTLWIGTDNGLIRAGEEEWNHYDTTDGLDSNIITALIEINETLIVGTHYGGAGGGLNILTENGWQKMPFPSGDGANQPSYMVNVLFADKSTGLLLVGTDNGLATFDGANWEHLNSDIGLPHNQISAIGQMPDGGIIIGTAAGAVMNLNGAPELLEPLRDFPVIDIVVDERERVWFTGTGGVWRLATRSGDWQRFSNETDDFEAHTLTDGLVLASGALIFGTTEAGLVRFRGGEFDMIRLEENPRQSSTWNILEGPDSLLYFLEEYDCGLDSFNPASDQWQRVGVVCAPIAFGPDGTFYANNFDDGIFREVNGEERLFTTLDGLPTSQPYAFALRDSELWIAGEEGVARIDGNDNIQAFLPDEIGLQDAAYFTVLPAADGSVWIGSRTGVARYDGDAWEIFEEGDPFTPNLGAVTDLAQDKQGRIWVSTFGDGLFVFDGTGWKQYTAADSALPSFVVNTVVVDPAGRVWAGTDNGAAWFDGSSWQSLTPENGFVHPNILTILVRNNEEVWFGTSGGIMRLQFR